MITNSNSICSFCQASGRVYITIAVPFSMVILLGLPVNSLLTPRGKVLRIVAFSRGYFNPVIKTPVHSAECESKETYPLNDESKQIEDEQTAVISV